MKAIFAIMNTALAVVKIRPEKKKHQCSALPAQHLLMTNYFCHHHYYRDRYHYLDYYLLPRATIYNSFC